MYVCVKTLFFSGTAARGALQKLFGEKKLKDDYYYSRPVPKNNNNGISLIFGPIQFG